MLRWMWVGGGTRGALHQPRARARCRLGVPIECEQPARRAETVEECARVPATPERGVDVGAVRSHRQCGNGFLEQDGDVFTAIHQRLKP